jgi:hypothetical protein
MNLTTLQNFRQEIYTCMERAGDVLFTAVDALVAESQAQPFPELSLSPFFPRSWSNLYKGFKRGKINRERLQDVFIKYLMFGQSSSGSAWEAMSRPFLKSGCQLALQVA